MRIGEISKAAADAIRDADPQVKPQRYVRVSGPLYTVRAAESALAKLRIQKIYPEAVRASMYIKVVGAGTFYVVRPN